MAAPDVDKNVYIRRRIPSAAIGPERHVYLNDSAVYYDSVESVPVNARIRPRYSYNESLSSLNESDYDGGAYDSTVEEYQDEPVTISKEQVATSLSRFGAILQMLSKIPFPRMSVTGMGLCSLVAIFICPRTLGSNILFPGFRLLFGTLYPAYASYKAVRTKNVKEYVKWMMYWIVFAFFTCIETFTDILLSWFPFYYEIKVIIVLWLLSPATRGSSTLYRKFVHPMLTRREQEIDDYINQAKEKGYTAVLQLGSKGVNYATNVIMQTAIKALNTPQLPSLMRHSQSDNAIASATLTEVDAETSQVDGPSLPERTSLVRRSHSAESALNKATSKRSHANTRNHSIIYEIDSEEEEQMLAEAQAAIEQYRAFSETNDELHFDEASSLEVEDGSARSRAVTKKTTKTSTTGRSRRTTPITNGAAPPTKTVNTRGRRKLRKDSETMDVDVD
ncbi:receptor expression-enhancing protein 2-like isoform X6 [Armigeres subalbatus]|uniref:receptor expression-enhancing protein 2-like isoform X6 n=1 Tax=Armigeres subalbatus TaxID=124917 RepID=UPI002ED2E31E